MALISIKRFLDLSSGDAYRHMLELLVETVSEHPINLDHAECERFKAELAEIQERFGADPAGEQFSEAVGSVSQALEQHHRSVANLVRQQGSELQNMIGMLTQTITSLGSASETSARHLEAIALRLKQASALQDICQLRLRLGACLKNMCDEAARQRQESQGNLQVLKEELAATQQRLSNHGIQTEIDRVTGFAGRSAAEVALHDAVQAPESRYVVVAVLGKMQAINARFGYAVGDEVLCEFAARVAGRLCSRAAFYRWSGPTILGILQRPEPLHVVRAEAGRIIEAPIAKSLISGQQNAFISTSAASLVIPVAPPAGELIARIDNFVHGQIPLEYCQTTLS
jgi:GGDEF domain-containing protein